VTKAAHHPSVHERRNTVDEPRQYPMKTDTPRPIRLDDYRPSSYLIDKVELDITLHPTDTLVRSKLTIRPNPAHRGKPGALKLDGEHLKLQSIKLDGKPLTAGQYRQSATRLALPKVPDALFTLETVVTVNPEANTALQGLYRSRGIFCTQCEAEGFRRITFFLDRPDVLSVSWATETPLRPANSTAANATSPSGMIPTPNLATSSLSSAVISQPFVPPSRPCPAAKSTSASTWSMARRPAPNGLWMP
jgi:hypothetical protein